MIDRCHIGLESEERCIEVERGQLRLFAKAIGETDPIYSDDGAARAAGYSAMVAPVTYAVALATLAPQETGSMEAIGIDRMRALHGEQSFTYHRPICAGDRIRIKSRISDIYQRKGGALDFVVYETTLINQHDELTVSFRMVVVQRNELGAAG
ncbi:MAG: hypothetical protein Tsb0016_25360 [Sphingomonadales bacterium]